MVVSTLNFSLGTLSDTSQPKIEKFIARNMREKKWAAEAARGERPN